MNRANYPQMHADMVTQAMAFVMYLKLGGTTAHPPNALLAVVQTHAASMPPRQLR